MADEATLDFGQSTPAGRATADAEEARRRRALLGLVVQQAAAAQPAAAAPPGPPVPDTRRLGSGQFFNPAGAPTTPTGQLVASGLPPAAAAGPSGPDMQSAPDTQPSAAEQARNPNLRPNPLAGLTPGRISGYTGDIPGMPQISDGSNPVPSNMAALFAGRGGYVSPERGAGGAVMPNANGVLASRALPERQLSEAEYNSQNAARSPNGSFPSFQAAQASSSGTLPPAPTGNQMLDNFRQQQAVVDQMVGPRPTFQSHGMGFERDQREWSDRREALLNNVRSGELVRGQVAQQAANTNEAAVRNAGSPAQLAADADARTALREREDKLGLENPNWSPARIQRQAAQDNGMTIDQADRIRGRQVIRDLVAPGVPTPGNRTRPENNEPQTGTRNPWIGIERQLNEASGYTGGTPAGRGANGSPVAAVSGTLPTTTTPTSFITRLQANNPGMLRDNAQAVVSYMANRFDKDALNQWFTRSSPERTALMEAINTARPGTVGPRIPGIENTAPGTQSGLPDQTAARAENRAFVARHAAAPRNIANTVRQALGLEPEGGPPPGPPLPGPQ